MEHIRKDKTKKQNHKNILEIRQVIQSYGDVGKIYLGGIPMIADDMMTFIQSDIVVFGMGVLLFIFYWLLITLSITIFKDWSYGIIFLLIAPIMAMVNFRYWIILIKVKARWNYKSASKNDEFERTKEAFDRVQKKFS